MIGKIIIGKSFSGCLLYCLNDKQKIHKEEIMEGRAEVLKFNQCFGNTKELIQQFNDVRNLNPKLSKPVLHITLSLAPGEKLEKNKLIEMSEACAKEFGFDNNQYLIIHHKDTGHQHMHIIANRIGFDKRTVSDSNNFKKMANYCRKMEATYGLKQVLNPKRFLSKEQRSIPRFDNRKEQLKASIKQALGNSKNYAEFEQKMKEKGYQIIKGRGISFIDDKKFKVKGSDLNYSLQTIERMLEKQQLFRQSKPDSNQLLNRKFSVSKLEDLLPKKSFSNTENLKKDISETLYDIMKPEQNQQHLINELLPKKRKKKRQHHHL